MSDNWNSLDNAAIIFPAASERTDTQVFRMTCELVDKVKPDILQSALDETIRIFKVYQSVLKRGVFWYYLERTDIMPVVHMENTLPCVQIYNRHHKKLLFDVSYFNNRLNLEVYHVLSDAMGALDFLKTLVCKYLSRAHHLPEPPLTFDTSDAQMSDDSFRRYYTGTLNVKQKMHRPAYQLGGARYAEDRLKVITGLVGLGPLVEAAHRHHATLTVFLGACLMKAISETVPAHQKKNPVVLAIPVDLRRYFPSASVRNFFSVLLIEYDFANRSGGFEDIIMKIGDDLNAGRTRESLLKQIDANSAVEHLFIARILPLFLKDPALKFAYNFSMRHDTAGLSNIGMITLPPELSPFVRSFDIAASTNKLQVCLCSYQGKISISFSSSFISSEIPRRFFKFLTDLNAEVEITTNYAGDGRGVL